MAMTNSKPLVALRISLFLSLVVFSNFADAENTTVLQLLPELELAALQALLGAWNESTKDVNSSLPGWVSFDPAQAPYDPCMQNPWQGVFCNYDYTKPGILNATIIGLTVSNASIVGTLPGSVWNFTNMVSLTLTENPGLNGSIPLLPENVGYPAISYLKSMDLYGNAFDGSLSDDLFQFYNIIQDLNLSNNHLEGSLPKTLGLNIAFETLRVSNNTLAGNISEDITLNWYNIITMDFSCNQFVGNIPNFSNSPYLYSLNISHNNFSGGIKLSTILNPQTNESMAILDLSDNKFTGPMPDVGNWPYLQSL